MNEFKEVDIFKFKHPFSALVAGPSQAGKTEFIKTLLRFSNQMVEPSPTKIKYCYSMWQDKFIEMEKSIDSIEFHQGIYPIEQLSSENNTLIVLDDLMIESKRTEDVLDMFTRGSHHKNFSVILLTQNLFDKGPCSRTISLNAHYIIMFNNPRDRSQISFLARQMYPRNSKFLEEAYEDATSKPHSYLLIDLKQTTPEDLRVQSNIFPGEERYAYLKY